MRLKEIEYTSGYFVSDDGQVFSKSVVATKNGVDVATYSSIKEAAEAVCAWPQNISNAIAGRRKTAMGFQWRFACRGGAV